MKKVLVLICLFLTASTIVRAQQGWYLQNPIHGLFAVSFTDANTGTAVGDGGIILRTTNGGATWVPQQSRTTEFLGGVSFIDANTGTAVGANGTILRTTDGGTTWVRQPYKGWAYELTDVSFTDANTGTIVGTWGGILRTTDGGANWTTQVSGTTRHLLGVSFTDVNTGTVVGDSGTILRTTDGGANWTSQVSGTTNRLNSVSFTSANIGNAVGYKATILRTIDGGTNWTSQSSGTTAYFTGVCFTDTETGTAVGSGGTIIRTTDGGTNWTSQSSGTTDDLRCVSSTDANTGTILCTDYNWNGKILRTTNGGATWTSQLKTATEQLLRSVSFANTDTGTAVGMSGTIVHTTNGGTNWTRQSSGTSRDLYAVSFTDANTGTAVGLGGTIIRTTDGGTTWASQSSGTTNNLMDVCFTDTETGTAVGSGGTIIRTTDGGTTWASQSSGTTNGLYGVSFTDAATGTAVGDGGIILRTTNGGTNWTSQSSGTTAYFTAVSFIDANTGTAVGSGGTIVHTTNGGTNWTSQSSGTTYLLHDVSFTDANTGTTVGDAGLFRTTDGGATWVSQSVAGYGVCFTDANTGTVVGSGGTISRTTDGGWNNPYVATISSSAVNGTINPAGTKTFTVWSNARYTFSPSIGYQFDSLIVDGVNIPDSTSSFTFYNINSSHTIRAVFARIRFTITSSAVNGVITPLGSTLFDFGGNQRYTYSPNTGYQFDSLIVDGVNIPDSTSSFTFYNINSSHTIRAVFARIRFTITSSAYNGTINPSGITRVYNDSTQQYTYSPNTGYYFANLTVDGVAVPESASSYTFKNVIANHTITAVFLITRFTITASAEYGFIYPSESAIVNYGSNQDYIFGPNFRFYFDSLIVDGVNVPDSTSSYTFKNVTANHTIKAIFAPNILSGKVFYDIGCNGMVDSSDPGIPRWKVNLSGKESRHTYTDEDGHYYFSVLDTGDYNIIIDTVWSWRASYPIVGKYSVHVGLGETLTKLDFGNCQDSGSISGFVFHDMDEDGIIDADSGETGLSGWYLKLSQYDDSPIQIYTTTDSSGKYSFNNLPMGNYAISQTMKRHWNQTYPLNDDPIFINLSHDENSSNNNFGNKFKKCQDLAIEMGTSNSRPGFPTYVAIWYYNFGSDTIDATVQFIYPYMTSLNFTNPPFTYHEQIARTVVWNIDSIPPGKVGYIWMIIQIPIPPIINIGDVLIYHTIIEPIAGDINPLNNIQTIRQTVGGSYDPNDKVCQVDGLSSSNEITDTTQCKYTIRFQNTGTDTAFTIVIKDTLDPYLDISTIESWVSSHPSSFEISGARELKWTFSNVNLPDSNVNEPGSNGFVSFNVKPLYTAQGQIVKNTASIYFDFNLPVQTNTVENYFYAVQKVYHRSGWNMVSVPSNVLDNQKNTIFPGTISEAFYYDNTYQEEDSLKCGTGYWLKFTTSDSLRIVGVPVEIESVSVSPRWNLIGSISKPIATSSITSDPPGIVTSSFFGYGGNYVITDTLSPGFGYWIKVNQDGKLILDANASASTLAKNRIKITSTNEMPPPPPGESTSFVDAVPQSYALEQAYPSPFNPTTTIKYQLPIDSRVTLKVYNVLGQVVHVLSDEVQSAGYRSATWTATGYASGIYFYRLDAVSLQNPSKSFTLVKKMVLVK